MDCNTPGSPVLHYLPEFATESCPWMFSNHLILCHPLLLLPSIFLSIKVFSNELALHIRRQSIRTSASASILPMNIQDWFPLGGTDLISLQSKGLSRVFSNTTVQKYQFFGWCLAFFIFQLRHSYMTAGKTIALSRWTFVGKVMSLLFNILCSLVITFLPRSKHKWIKNYKTPIKYWNQGPVLCSSHEELIH